MSVNRVDADRCSVYHEKDYGDKTPPESGSAERSDRYERRSAEDRYERRSAEEWSSRMSRQTSLDLESRRSHRVRHSHIVPNEAKRSEPIFADAEAMKERLRQNMCKPSYDVTEFYHETGLFQMIARSRTFENLTLGVIAMNAVYISIDTDLNQAVSLLDANAGFQIMEHFFCYYFSCEWFIRFMSFRRKRDGCRDAWFVFDSSMVVMMVTETWIMSIVLVLTGTSTGGGLGNASMMRLLRLLRLSRMARMARLLRAMPELLILIKGMVSAMRSVFFTLLLQVIILYVFGITFRQLTEGLPTNKLYFSNVGTSMHSLLIHGTLMDNIGEVVTHLGKDSFVFPVVFYIFVLVSALTVMNMLIGVLCEVVSAVASTERESLTVAYVKGRLQDILKAGGLDCDGDGMISKVEFAQLLENAQAARILSEVGVDVFGLVELSDFIFVTDDDDPEKGKQLSFGDFMEVVLQLRGVNNATVKDIVDLRKFITAMSKNLEHRLAVIEDRVQSKMWSHHNGGAKASSMNAQGAPEYVARKLQEQRSPSPNSRSPSSAASPASKRQNGVKEPSIAEAQPVTAAKAEASGAANAAWGLTPLTSKQPSFSSAVGVADASPFTMAMPAALVWEAYPDPEPAAVLAEETGMQGTNVSSDIAEVVHGSNGRPVGDRGLATQDVADVVHGSNGRPPVERVERGCAVDCSERERLLLNGLDRVRAYLDKLAQGFGGEAARLRLDTEQRAKEIAAADVTSNLLQVPKPCAVQASGSRMGARQRGRSPGEDSWPLDNNIVPPVDLNSVVVAPFSAFVATAAPTANGGCERQPVARASDGIDWTTSAKGSNWGHPLEPSKEAALQQKRVPSRPILAGVDMSPGREMISSPMSQPAVQQL